MCIHICRYILIFRLERVLPTVTMQIYLRHKREIKREAQPAKPSEKKG